MAIEMSNLANGTDITALAASKLTGALPAISGAALTNLPGGGLGGFETFTSSGTWNYSAAGSPANVWVCLQGGGGGAAREKDPRAAGGGAGGTIMWRKIAVNGNVSVTIGAAGSNNLQGIGGDKSTNAVGSSGGTTSFGGTSVGGGGGGSATSTAGGGSGGSATGSGAFTGMKGTSWTFGMGGQSPFGSRGSGGSTSGTRAGIYYGTAVNPGAGLVIVAY
jgi:hypothetical protein